jgi:hypothetical protein
MNKTDVSRMTCSSDEAWSNGIEGYCFIALGFSAIHGIVGAGIEDDIGRIGFKGGFNSIGVCDITACASKTVAPALFNEGMTELALSAQNEDFHGVEP